MKNYTFENCIKEFNLCDICDAEEVDEDDNCPYDDLKIKTRCLGFSCSQQCRFCDIKCIAYCKEKPFNL